MRRERKEDRKRQKDREVKNDKKTTNVIPGKFLIHFTLIQVFQNVLIHQPTEIRGKSLKSV